MEKDERVVQPCLFSEQHEIGFFIFSNLAQQLGDRERVERLRGVHVDGAVGAHGQARAERVLALRPAHAHHHHLRGVARLAQPQRLLQRDLAERVHGHLHVGRLHSTLQFPWRSSAEQTSQDSTSYFTSQDMLVTLIVQCYHLADQTVDGTDKRSIMFHIAATNETTQILDRRSTHLVALDADFDGVVDHALHRHHDLHREPHKTRPSSPRLVPVNDHQSHINTLNEGEKPLHMRQTHM